MRKSTVNTFNEGMIKDLNPLNTPNNVLTDAVNATFITYNGNEFVLQNDMGNCKVERARLSVGFIPVGMKEYGGIIYVASYNPETNQSEIGSFPSPERDFSTTDFENLSPVNFQTSQFVVDTGGGQQEKTSVIGKLVEPELLQLNPGDLYVVVFDTHGGDTDGQTPIPDYISKDVAERKLFRLKFYKITEENNLSDLNADDVKLIEDQEILDDEYVPFKENSKGTIAVGLELETLDLFDINVVDTSKRTDETKSAVIEAIGFSDSLADFKGVKVVTSSPSAETFYINKTGAGKKVSAKLTELAADSKVTGTITPYSAYALYPKLRKDFNLELGKYASSEDGVNNIFKYRVDNNYIKVDFDFKFEGNNPNGLEMYVEFYDPWSDYSIVKVVDDPTYYGVNTIQLELVDEPRSETFDEVTTGGTPTNLLITNPDTTYQKTMLNSTNLIRTTTSLRKNHFYIVRVSGIDIDYSEEEPVYTHYDFYKGLYTNDLLNTLYDQQNSIQTTDPNYVSDFNTVDFKVQDLAKFDVTITNAKPSYTKSKLLNFEDGEESTNTNYYDISDTVESDGSFKSGYRYTKEANTDLNFNLNTSKYIFGEFKDEIIDVELPNLDSEEGPVDPLLDPIVEDIGYDNEEDINPDSVATIEAKKINDTKYRIKKTLVTNRWVYGDKELYEDPLGTPTEKIVTKNVKVDKRFSAMNTAQLEFKARQIKMGPGTFSTCKTNKFDHTTARNMIDGVYPGQYQAVIFAIGRATPTSDIPNSCQYNTYAGGRYIMVRFDDGYRWDGQELALMRDVGGYYPTQITGDSKYILSQAYPEFRIYSQVNQTVYVYYPVDIIFNDTITTNAEFNNLYYNINYSPISGKTYLSEFYFRANNETSDFSTSVINNYISSRKGDSVIVDDKETINDGFIPYIEDEEVTKVPLANDLLTIVESAPSNIVSLFETSENRWKDDPAFNVSQQYTHGQLYSRKTEFDELANLFLVKTLGGTSFPDGVEVTEDNFQLWANHNNNTTPSEWKGIHRADDFKVVGNEGNPSARFNIKINN